jgi:arsenate reductase (thioredoxin)
MLAEFVGTALLAAAVVGSGIMAMNLTPDPGLRLLAIATVTGLALVVLILIFGPVSGAHLNPVISAADWFLGRRTGTGLTVGTLAGYVVAQTCGAVAGAMLANLMFARPAVELSGTIRSGAHLWLGEVVATAGLVLVIFALARTGRARFTSAAVGGYIAAACWFTSATAFSNPALTLGRSLTDTLAGIAPASVPGFATAQLVGLVLGVGLLLALYPTPGHSSDLATYPDRRLAVDTRPTPNRSSGRTGDGLSGGEAEVAGAQPGDHVGGDVGQRVEVRAVADQPQRFVPERGVGGQRAAEPRTDRGHHRRVGGQPGQEAQQR